MGGAWTEWANTACPKEDILEGCMTNVQIILQVSYLGTTSQNKSTKFYSTAQFEIRHLMHPICVHHKTCTCNISPCNLLLCT